MLLFIYLFMLFSMFSYKSLFITLNVNKMKYEAPVMFRYERSKKLRERENCNKK